MTKKLLRYSILSFITFQAFAGSGKAQQPRTGTSEKERVFILTDISNEPDDEESLVRFLVYSNQFDIEGIAATTSTYLKKETREDLIRRQIAAYSEVRSNLILHENGFPTKDQLLAVTSTGQTTFGMAAVGKGKTTAASKQLLAAAGKQDNRPLWVCVWGGANTLAQALHDARTERSAEEVTKLVKKLRVYSISDQDDAGPWLRKQFPDLFYIVSPSNDWKEYWRATWTGISGDRHYKNGPFYKFNMVDNPWLEENVINNHGPLGKLYPKLAYIMEGDTPSFLGLINNGLGWAVSPANGGWGGRYALYKPFGETRSIWTNNHDSRDRVFYDSNQSECSDAATIWRWRQEYQNDFAARMDWCVTNDYAKANHNPVAVLNGDRSRNIINIAAKQGIEVKLSGAGSSDPDKNNFSFTWFVYKEAGSYKEDIVLSSVSNEEISFTAPKTDKAVAVHIILKVEDNGIPSLSAYRRAIVTIQP